MDDSKQAPRWCTGVGSNLRFAKNDNKIFFDGLAWPGRLIAVCSWEDDITSLILRYLDIVPGDFEDWV